MFGDLGLAYLPLATVILSVCTFFISYAIAVAEEDVRPYFPYISDTGTTPPESCIFGQFLNISAALAMCTIYVRYKLVESIVRIQLDKITRLNRVGLVFGLLSALGLSIVANFQETSVEVVHLIGAAAVFLLGVVYAFIHTALSYTMCPDFNGRRVCHIRLVITILSLLATVAAGVAGVISRYQGSPDDRLKWKPEDGGFDAHVTSTIAEWVTALTFLSFFLTYVSDFRKIKIEICARMQVRHLDEEPYLNEEPSESSRLLYT